MATHKDLQECFDITGVDPLAIVEPDFDTEHLKNLNPKVYQYMVWKYREKENPNLKLSEVQDLDFNEIRKAVSDFFTKDIATENL